MAIIDETGFSILYCFIEFEKGGLKEVKTILSDKDFAQISSGTAVWKIIEVQLANVLCNVIMITLLLKEFSHHGEKILNRMEKVQCNNKYPFLYDAQQTIWQTITNDLPEYEVEYYNYEEAEVDLNMDEYDSSNS
ncbi:9590_t:CDS:2 [Gigaspora margarita]|uniref:9590_t:CDS:1 n=1 Tax=Gigaspora margarita TaxID=4874 RepID=A0ABN7UQI7_GIGMA|nr:9590_t:CDS:2 [Gigaspora margarita]